MIEPNKIHLGDCFEVMKTLPDHSFDAIITDPPYFEIKGAFDFEYKDFAEYLQFMELLAQHSKRLLKDKGTFICFGHALRIAYLQVIFDKYFNLLNSCVWRKICSQTMRCEVEAMRSFMPITERFLVYEQLSTPSNSRTGLQEIYSNPDCFQSIKKYMREERRKLMQLKGFTTISQCDQYLNEITNTSSVVSRHYFADSQYIFPTPEIYKKLQSTGFWGKPYEAIGNEYKGLRNEYEVLRNEYEDLRRPFNLQKAGLYDVLDFSQDAQQTKNFAHPTQKPLPLMKTLIETVTRKNDIILDPFAGSGTTAAAAIMTDRNFTIIEKDENYYKICIERCNEAQTKRNSQLF